MRKNRAKLLISIIVVTALVLLAAIVVIVVGKKTMDEYKSQLSELQAELSANQQSVYVASMDILPGEKIEEGINVYKQVIYTGLDASYYISADDLGGIAKINITAGEPVTANEVTTLSITQDTREYEISVASLMTDQKENEYVDIRIMFPNGEDFIILPKKQVLNLSLENCVFFTYLNEDEILRMASATIDAFTVSGTKIYTTRYVESSLQEDATPTYVVKAETIDLINKDPNITKIATSTMSLQARMDLESRLKGLTEEQLKAVLAGHELEDTAKTNVLLGNTYYTSELNGTAEDFAVDTSEDTFGDEDAYFAESGEENAPASEEETSASAPAPAPEPATTTTTTEETVETTEVIE